MHPLLQILAAILLIIVIDEFLGLIIGLWHGGEER